MNECCLSWTHPNPKLPTLTKSALSKHKSTHTFIVLQTCAIECLWTNTNTTMESLNLLLLFALSRSLSPYLSLSLHFTQPIRFRCMSVAIFLSIFVSFFFLLYMKIGVHMDGCEVKIQNDTRMDCWLASCSDFFSVYILWLFCAAYSVQKELGTRDKCTRESVWACWTICFT